MNDDIVEPTPLPNRNAMHYDGRVFERVDWSQRGAYMKRKHGVTPAIADEARSKTPTGSSSTPTTTARAARASGSSDTR